MSTTQTPVVSERFKLFAEVTDSLLDTMMPDDRQGDTKAYVYELAKQWYRSDMTRLRLRIEDLLEVSGVAACAEEVTIPASPVRRKLKAKRQRQGKKATPKLRRSSITADLSPQLRIGAAMLVMNMRTADEIKAAAGVEDGHWAGFLTKMNTIGGLRKSGKPITKSRLYGLSKAGKNYWESRLRKQLNPVELSAFQEGIPPHYRKAGK